MNPKNPIVKTETYHPEDPSCFTLWIKHHFKDGTWICLFRPKHGWYSGEDPNECLALDFGLGDLIDGRIVREGKGVWEEFHGTVNDIINGDAAIVIHNYGTDIYGDVDMGVTIEAY